MNGFRTTALNWITLFFSFSLSSGQGCIKEKEKKKIFLRKKFDLTKSEVKASFKLI